MAAQEPKVLSASPLLYESAVDSATSADRDSRQRPSVSDNKRGHFAVRPEEPEEPVRDNLGPATFLHAKDTGCCGSNGYVYPFKVKMEERYPMKDPALYTEFEKRYPPDRFGEEASDNARVWKLYRDRVTERDEDQIEGWNKTLDILLIFAGLFSAVATAFIIEAYKQLQPDYSEILAKAFIASLNGTATSDLSSFGHFSRPSLARWVNTLWFLSLTLALVVALLAILAKQWLGEYTSRMRRHISSHRHWAWRHLVYHDGLENWGMDAFISALPLMLHLSLLLFLVGLVAFLSGLDWVIVGFVLPLTVMVMVFYVWATVAPLWFGDCPTATPILRQGRRALELLQTDLRRRLICVRESIRLRLNLRSWREVLFQPTPWHAPAYEEKVLLQGMPARRDAKTLCWMVTSLPAVEEVQVALDAIGSLDPLDHRREFHLGPNGVEGVVPAPGDILCLGQISIAAATRFQRLCEGATVVDAASISRCIRTLLALSINRLGALLLPESLLLGAQNLLHQWATIPIYDLHLLCGTFGAFWNNSQMLDIRDALLAWKGDASPVTGEIPYISSSIALSFLRCRFHTRREAADLALIYSTLAVSFTSSALDPARRRAVLVILHDAVVASMQGSSIFTHVGPRVVMQTPQQLQFRAMSTIGALSHFSRDYAPSRMCHILITDFVHLVWTLPGVEGLTLEHIPYARDLLDMVLRLEPDNDQVGRKLLALIGNYLCRLERWSEDAGEVTRRLVELYSSPHSSLQEVDLAALLALNLARSYHRNISQSSEVSVRHSLANLLLPGVQGGDSVWRTLCGTSPRGIPAVHIVSLAVVLARYLTFFMRRGFDVTDLAEEFFGEDRLCNLIRAARFNRSTMHVSQHAKELSPGWWEDMKARLLSLASTDDVEPAVISNSIMATAPVGVTDGSSVTMPSPIISFVQEVDALDQCQTCFDGFKEETAQGVVGNHRNSEPSALGRAYRRALVAIIGVMRRRRAAFAPGAEDHELPVTAPHRAQTCITQSINEGET